MAGAIDAFFDDLAARGSHLLPSQTVGTIRFDLVDGPHTEHWLLEFNRGTVRVRHEYAEADCVVFTTYGMFDGIVTGKENVTAMLIRGVIAVEGDLRLLSRFRKLLPGSPDARHPRSFAPAGGRKR